MRRPSLSWAERRSLSISHMGPTVCLTRWARFATLCNSVANCWNWTSNQPLYPQNRKSLLMSFPVKLPNCKKTERNKSLEKPQTHAICLCLVDGNRCMSSPCAAITVRKMAIFWRLTRQKAQHGIRTLIQLVLYVSSWSLVGIWNTAFLSVHTLK